MWRDADVSFPDASNFAIHFNLPNFNDCIRRISSSSYQEVETLYDDLCVVYDALNCGSEGGEKVICKVQKSSKSAYKIIPKRTYLWKLTQRLKI